jgi:hypothetical protein
MRQTTLATNSIDFSLNSFENLINFKNLFKNIKKSWEQDHRDLVFERKDTREQDQYFNFMKFIFTSPDKI